MDAVATAKLTLEKSSFESGLKQAEGAVANFAKQTAGLLAGAFAFDKILEGFSSAIEKGDQLQDLANRFGVSASALQEVGNAASLSGAGVEDVASAMNKLAVNAGKAIGGDDAMVKAFEDIGLSVAKLQGMSPQDIFYALSESIQNTANPLEAFAKAQSVAGKSVGALMETLRMGPSAIQEMGDAMGIWSDDEISQLGAASDAIKEFQNTQTIWFGKTLIGISSLIERYQDLIEAIYLHIRANRDENLDAAGRASLYEQSAGKTADVVMGRSDIQKNASKGTSAVADKEASNATKKAQKEFEQSEKDAAKQELKLIEAKIKGEEDAQNLAKKFEEDAAKKKEKAIQDAADDEAKYQEELFKAEMDAAKFESSEKIRLMRLQRETQKAEGGAAGQRLDIAAGLGGGVAAEVEKARKKAAEDQKKISAQELDKQVMANTSATTDRGAERTMASRRSEYIQTQAKKEAEGKTTLDDINKTLQDALAKLTSAPLVS
jgi:hypothetical protein